MREIHYSWAQKKPTRFQVKPDRSTVRVGVSKSRSVFAQRLRPHPFPLYGLACRSYFLLVDAPEVKDQWASYALEQAVSASAARRYQLEGDARVESERRVRMRILTRRFGMQLGRLGFA